MSTDASKVGWGCVINSIKTRGLWTQDESNYHINYLEMLAVYFGLKAHQNLVSKMSVKVLVDNTTVQNTHNEMGTSHSHIKTIWDWCITNVTVHGKTNKKGDDTGTLF